MARISILDLKTQYKGFRNKVVKKIERIMSDQDFILGAEVSELEHAIAKYCGTKYALGVASGTDALILSLRAYGVGPGDEVITTPYTFMATAEAVALLGAKPVFVDIDPDTYNMDPRLIEARITGKTKAVIPVHLYGLCADMDPILKTAKKHGLKVIEDTAQAIGSRYKGRMAGSMGDAGAISFFPSKNLGAFGDAGMIVTNDERAYKILKLLRVHGSDRRYYHDIIGYNSRLDNIQAAVLNIKLKYLDKWIRQRIETAEYFDKRFKDLPLKTPARPEGYKHSYHLYTLRSQKRSELEGHLVRNGVEARTYYPVPLHLQRCFSYLGYRQGDLPQAEKASGEVFAIPAYPELALNEKKHVANTVRSFFAR